MENKKILILIVGSEKDKNCEQILSLIEKEKERDVKVICQDEKLTYNDLIEDGYNNINILGVNIPEENLIISNLDSIGSINHFAENRKNKK